MVLIFKRNSVQRSNPNWNRFVLAEDGTWVLMKIIPTRSVPYWKWSKKEEKEEAAINNRKRKNDE